MCGFKCIALRPAQVYYVPKVARTRHSTVLKVLEIAISFTLARNWSLRGLVHEIIVHHGLLMTPSAIIYIVTIGPVMVSETLNKNVVIALLHSGKDFGEGGL